MCRYSECRKCRKAKFIYKMIVGAECHISKSLYGECHHVEFYYDEHRHA
jgi:hypothetical protein